MAINQLQAISVTAAELTDMVRELNYVPEWGDGKIATVLDRLNSLRSHMLGKLAGRDELHENQINEADMTNDPAVQKLIKDAEFEASKNRLFPEDVEAIKQMARDGYGAAEIKRHKRLRF